MELRRAPSITTWLVLAVLLAGCTGAASAAALPLRTQASPGPNTICMFAKIAGTLAADPITGLGLGNGSGRVAHVYWPFGYTSRSEGGLAVLVDPANRVVARIGDSITLGGGYGSDGAVVVCAQSIQVQSPPPPS